MSGSFGAGFFTLTLMAVLAGLAGLLGLIALASRRRAGQVPTLVRSIAMAGLVGVVLVGGLGVLALYDDATVGAGLIVALVFVPLAAASVRGWQVDQGWSDVLAGVAMAWSLPFILGLPTFLAVSVGVIEAFQLAGGEARAPGPGLDRGGRRRAGHLNRVRVALRAGCRVAVAGRVLTGSPRTGADRWHRCTK